MHGSEKVAQMGELLSHMGSVDLAELAARLMDFSGDEEERLLLLTHTTAYVEHLSQCAAEFLRLARWELPSGTEDTSDSPHRGPSHPRRQHFREESHTKPQRPSSLRPPPRLWPQPPRSPDRYPEALARVLHQHCESSTSPSPPSVARTMDSRSASPPEERLYGGSSAETTRVSPRINEKEVGGANAGVPSRTPSPPQPESPALAIPATAAGEVGRVLPVAPAPAPAESGAASTAASAAKSGDCLELQPGLYYESMSLRDCGTLEVTAAYPGAPVVLRPANNLEPVLCVRGPTSCVTVRGIIFVLGDVSEEAIRAPALSAGSSVQWRQRQQRFAHRCPLVSVEEGAELIMEGCHLYNGGAGGLVAAGAGTVVRLRLCLVSLCAFAGVYAHSGARLELCQCRIKNSECGLRVADEATTLHARETTVEGNTTDGVVVHGPCCVCVLERSTVGNNGGSGLFLETGSEARLLETAVELNAVYGVHRSRGSRLHLQRSSVRDNGLLPISEERP